MSYLYEFPSFPHSYNNEGDNINIVTPVQEPEQLSSQTPIYRKRLSLIKAHRNVQGEYSNPVFWNRQELWRELCSVNLPPRKATKYMNRVSTSFTQSLKNSATHFYCLCFWGPTDVVMATERNQSLVDSHILTVIMATVIANWAHSLGSLLTNVMKKVWEVPNEC